MGSPMNKVFFSTKAAVQNKLYKYKQFTDENLQTKIREIKMKIKLFGYVIM